MKNTTLSLNEEKTTQIKPVIRGKDEMNLAEFPLVKLGKRDKRKVITYERYVKSKDKNSESYLQKWEVHGSIKLGLPDEVGDRVIVALMKLTAEQGFKSQEVRFSPYQILKILGWKAEGKNTYDSLANIIKQLVAITVFSDMAFYDKVKKKRVTFSKAFHIIEDMEWIREDKANEDGNNGGGSQSYIVWSDTIWKSLQSGCIKNLDLGFYYSLDNAIARRLYRFLDKWLYTKDEWEFDIFDVAGRLGMVRYKYPSEVKKALKPACDELVKRGFLVKYEFLKRGKYTRIRFEKAKEPTIWETLAKEATAEVTQTSDQTDTSIPNESRTGEVLDETFSSIKVDPWAQIFTEYGTTEALKDVWANILKELKQSLGHAPYHTFLANTALLAIDDGEAVVGVANIVGKEWLENRMERQLRRTLNSYLGTKITVLKFISVRDQM